MLNGVDRFQELTSKLTEQAQSLLRLELQLAQAELGSKAKTAARAGIFGIIAGVLLFYATFALMLAAVFLVGDVLDNTWLGALIVGIVMLILAALVGLIAYARMRRAGKPVPEAAIANARSIPQAIKDARG